MSNFYCAIGRFLAVAGGLLLLMLREIRPYANGLLPVLPGNNGRRNRK